MLCLILLGFAWTISFSSLSLLMHYDVYIADRLLIALYSRFCLIFDAKNFALHVRNIGVIKISRNRFCDIYNLHSCMIHSILGVR